MPNPSPSSVDIWLPYLKSDEHILWQGRPSANYHMRRGDVGRIIGGILAMVLIVLMAYAAFRIAGPLEGKSAALAIPFGLIYLIIFSVGLYSAVLQFYFAAKKRGRTHYAITNQRAMALTTGRKVKFEDGALDANTNLDYVPGALASIYYKKIAKRRANSSSGHGSHSASHRRKTTYSTEYTYQGFELIPNGAEAYETMLKVLGAKLANPLTAKSGKNGEAWEDFLFEGETLLWQGAPGTGPRPTKLGIVLTVIGVIFMYYFGRLAMRTLFSGIDDSGVMILGAIAALMFVLGLWMAVGIWLLDIRKRKAIRYALTNKRAFVANALTGRNMLTFALVPMYRPLLLKGSMDEVTFGEEDWFDGNGTKTKRAISFKYLKDGQEVYDILTKVSIEIDAKAKA